jgi:hypothetical protein
METIARVIENAYEEGLGEYLGQYSSDVERWHVAKHQALRALTLAESSEELQAFHSPESPSLEAGGLHPWAWEPARPLWEAGAYQEAVLSAARTVNARLQQKLDRHDTSESDLVLQSFDLKPPQAGRPRLRMPGADRSRPSWISAQEGAKFFGAGCYKAIRNLAAHVEDVKWAEQQALEYLAAFSVLARWVDQCVVEAV